MQWCLMALAIMIALLGMAALLVHPLRARPPKVRLGLLLRGCVAMLCLLAALGLVSLALLLSR